MKILRRQHFFLLLFLLSMYGFTYLWFVDIATFIKNERHHIYERLKLQLSFSRADKASHDRYNLKNALQAGNNQIHDKNSSGGNGYYKNRILIQDFTTGVPSRAPTVADKHEPSKSSNEVSQIITDFTTKVIPTDPRVKIKTTIQTSTDNPQVTQTETNPTSSNLKVTDQKVTDSTTIGPKLTEKRTDPEVTNPTTIDPTVTERKVTDSKVTDPKVADPTTIAPKVTEKRTEPKVTNPTMLGLTVTEAKVTHQKVANLKVTDPTTKASKMTEKRTDPIVTTIVSTLPITTERPTQSSTNTKPTGTDCDYERLPFKYPVKDIKEATCKAHKISVESCKYVLKEYKYEPEKYLCPIKEHYNICAVREEGNQVSFHCDLKACGAFTAVYILAFNPKTGKVETRKPGYANQKSLEEAMLKQAHKSSYGQDFIFVSCDGWLNRTQLVTFDSNMFKKNNPTKKESKININIVEFDSISREHFFRSLPKTISYLRTVNTDYSIKAEVFDYELFQSVHGHTHENFYAFFSGKTFPRNMTEDERDDTPPGYENMLKFAKQHGYRTLQQEDMCWQGPWGMRKDLGVNDDWEKVNEAIKTKSNIDDTGLTFSLCKMIRAVVPEHTHFFNVVDQICYMGMNIDTYIMRHLSKKLRNSKSNLFSFTALNVAHDAAGNRVQGFDTDLVEFMKNMTIAENTITIFFSDHGNTYTGYVYRYLDGRYEMYHPQMFIIVPDSVKKELGQETMNALRINQKRLFNLIDVHHTVKHLVDKNHPVKGILTPLPTDRSCADIPLSTPNLCLCQGWDSPVGNRTEYWPFVEFAIGHLNNLISDASPNMKCKRIVPTSFQNVLLKELGTQADLTFDVLARPGPGSGNVEERITLQVHYDTDQKLETFNTTLIASDRVSRYGEYRKCSDADTMFHFCICDMNDKDKKKKPKQLTFMNLISARNEYVFEITRDDLFIHEQISNLIEGELGLLERRAYEEEDKSDLVSSTFEIVNKSKDKTYEILVEFEDLENAKPLSKYKCINAAKPNSMRYLCTINRKKLFDDAVFKTKVTYKEVK